MSNNFRLIVKGNKNCGMCNTIKSMWTNWGNIKVTKSYDIFLHFNSVTWAMKLLLKQTEQ